MEVTQALTSRNLHDLQQLELHPGWKLYLSLLQQAYGDVYKLLKTTVVTPQDQASHNQWVGMLEGINKALRLVPVLIQQLEKE